MSRPPIPHLYEHLTGISDSDKEKKRTFWLTGNSAFKLSFAYESFYAKVAIDDKVFIDFEHWWTPDVMQARILVLRDSIIPQDEIMNIVVGNPAIMNIVFGNGMEIESPILEELLAARTPPPQPR